MFTVIIIIVTIALLLLDISPRYNVLVIRRKITIVVEEYPDV